MSTFYVFCIDKAERESTEARKVKSLAAERSFVRKECGSAIKFYQRRAPWVVNKPLERHRFQWHARKQATSCASLFNPLRAHAREFKLHFT